MLFQIPSLMFFGLRIGLITALSLSVLGWAEFASAEAPVEPGDEEMRFFESRIRPLLVQHCYDCHAGGSSEGGLRLDVNEALSQGGDSGPPVVPGDPDTSLLISAIGYDGLEMPPDEPLTPQQQADVRQWITAGAYWPADFDHVADPAATDPANDESWWAAEPIEPGLVPFAAGPSAASPIDCYVDQRLEEAGLRRAPRATRAQLIRRLHYDLLGLPPSPEMVDAFVCDERPDAYERLVDRLLSDPNYGERIGRLWLDLVRYAESDGYRADAYRPQAWRYRDWIVGAFNQSMPYDQFVSMQLAGDEIAPGEEDAMAAVGFYRLGIYEYNQRDAEGQWRLIVDELTDVTADVFLATGLACAKCHDHKFDPIPRADYFRLRSTFEPLLFVDQPAKSRPHTQAETAEIQRLNAELAEIEGETLDEIGRQAVDIFPDPVVAMYDKPAEQRNSYEHQIAHLVQLQVIDKLNRTRELDKALGKEAAARRDEILERLRELDADPTPPAAYMTVADVDAPIRPTRFPGRDSGKTFEPGVPELFGGGDLPVQPPAEAPRSSGRRLALARWMTSADNPITPRVMVNRLWQYLFGTGLVASPNDFGHLGSKPSHPRLLDHLAQRFVDSGWDIKAIQREIVLSETYRQSAIHPQAAAARTVDPENRLLWHRRVRRLDAEQFRDSLLVAMGRLRDQIGGPSLPGTPPRRSIYLQRKRNTGDQMLRLLDAPTGVVGTAKRAVTVTAVQALMMLNNPRLTNVAEMFAERVRRDLDPYVKVEETAASERTRANAFVRRAYRIATGVEPDAMLVSVLADVAITGTEGQADVCHALINGNAFLFVE